MADTTEQTVMEAAYAMPSLSSKYKDDSTVVPSLQEGQSVTQHRNMKRDITYIGFTIQKWKCVPSMKPARRETYQR